MANGHTNYSLKFGFIKGTEFDEVQFLEAQLFEAKHSLFAATTVREIRFLQSKIGYLRQQMIDMQKKERAKNRRARERAKEKGKKAKVRGKKPKYVRYAREDKYQPRAMLA
ncbi:MAG TPA: hypothetical protein VJJ76_00765 [archaeon]|nr:hypothetical protein [archaeon]